MTGGKCFLEEISHCVTIPLVRHTAERPLSPSLSLLLEYLSFSPSPTQKALLLQNLEFALVPGSTVPLQQPLLVFTGLVSGLFDQKFPIKFSC